MQEAEGFIKNAQQYAKIANEKLPDRYSPEIAHALHDEKLRESINNILQNTRPECYYKAYLEFSQ